MNRSSRDDPALRPGEISKRTRRIVLCIDVFLLTVGIILAIGAVMLLVTGR